MTVKTVLRMGHPLLAQVAEPVTEFNAGGLDSLLEDMFDTMAALNGAGLAAPQIGVSQRVVIFGFRENSRYPGAEEVPRTILINPTIKPLSPELEEGWEGCLSLPGMRGKVPRYTRIEYQGYNELGEPISREAEGFHARVVQHEVDHLDGVLYPQRIQDMSQFGFEAELLGRDE